MQRTLLVLFILLLIPASVLAARPPSSFSLAQPVAASSSPGNAYAAGASVVLTAPVAGDFSGVGGSIITAAPVTGDELLLAGSISSRGSVGGDVRAIGGSIVINGSVAGDLVAFGYSVDNSGRASGSVLIAAANTTMTSGAGGPVAIYGNNISLAGNFADDVHIFASGRVALAASTTIHGKLSYEAPELAIIPASVVIEGGVEYTNASYLPNVGTSRILALINMGFFIFVRILGALILAGLLAGLFPKFAHEVVERAYARRPRSILLTMLLGFAIFVATPILFVMLVLTFVGIGLAVLLLVAYALLILLALLYAGVFLGSALARSTAHRETVLWRDGVLGMLLFSLISLIPVVGLFFAVLLTLFAAGALLQIFFHFAFPREEHTTEML